MSWVPRTSKHFPDDGLAPGGCRVIRLNFAAIGANVMFWNNMQDAGTENGVLAAGGPAPFNGTVTGQAEGPSYFGTNGSFTLPAASEQYHIWSADNDGLWDIFWVGDLIGGAPGRRWTTTPQSGLKNSYPVGSIVSDLPPLYDVYRITVNGTWDTASQYWVGLCSGTSVTPATIQTNSIFARPLTIAGAINKVSCDIDVPGDLPPCTSVFLMKSNAFAAADDGTILRIYRKNKFDVSLSQVDV